MSFSMTPLILVRFLTLFIFLNCVGWCLAWMNAHRKERLYALPALLIFTHASLFYGLYLADYLMLRGIPFDLQWYADWGSLLMLHISFTSLFILIDLASGIFTKYIGRLRGIYTHG